MSMRSRCRLLPNPAATVSTRCQKTPRRTAHGGAVANGGKVAKFGFAVNNRRKNAATNQWEDEPVFIDIDVFNRGEQGRQADLVEQSLRKGHQVFIEGHLRLDQWTDKEGQKRQRLTVRV